MGHGHVTPNKDGSKTRCGGPGFCHVCAIEAASKSFDDSAATWHPPIETTDEKGEVIVAVALPPYTGNPLGNFIYEGKLPDKDFIRENGPSTEWSQGEEDDNGTPDTESNKP